MKTQSFTLARLRGVDLRYQVSSDSASDIQDMHWSLNDSWTSCGGFRPITNYNQNYTPWGDVVYRPLISADYLPAPTPGGGSTGGTSSSGAVSLGPSFGGADAQYIAIESLHWFAQHNGARQFMVWEDSDGKLVRFRGDTPSAPYVNLIDRQTNEWDGVERVRYVRTTPGPATQSVVWGGRIYMVNGQDEPIVYDGRVTGRAGYIQAPSPPSAELVFRDFSETDTSYWLGTRLRNQGLGSSQPFEASDGEGNYSDAKLCGYKYRVTFVNRRGQESPMSEPCAVVSFECGDEGKTRFVQVTLPTGDAETVARRIYRTRDIYDAFGQPTSRDYGFNFYFVKEVQDNITTVIEDGVSDGNLGSLADPEDFGPWPPQARFISTFKNTLFLAGMPNNQIRFSAPNMPEVFPLNNVFDISEGDGGEVTGIYPTRNALVIFKPRGIYLVKGDPLNGFYVQTLTKDIGCIAADSIAEVPGVGVVFLSESGIYVLEGALENTGSATGITELSVPIRKWFDDLSDSALSGAVGIVYHKDREFWLCLPGLGETENTVVYVFHYSVGAWSRRFDVPVRCAVETKDHRGYLFFGSGDVVARPGIYVYTHSEIRRGSSWGNPVGQVVQPLYQTSSLNFGNVYAGIQPAYVNIYAVARGSLGLSLNLNVNRELDQSLDEAKTREQRDLIQPELSFSSELLYVDDTKWGHYRPIPFRYDVSLMHESLVTELQLVMTATKASNPHIELVGYDIEAKVGAQRDIRVLTDVLTADRR